MASPNSQTSTPLQNLSTNQAIRLLAKLSGVNANATGDNAMPILNATTYSIKDIVIWGPSISISTAAIGIFTAPASAGTAILASLLLTAVTGSLTLLDSAPTTTAGQTAQTLYARVITAQGAASTFNVAVYGYDLDAPANGF
jgi:hypothetical protein